MMLAIIILFIMYVKCMLSFTYCPSDKSSTKLPLIARVLQ